MSKRPLVDVFDRQAGDLPEGWLNEPEATALTQMAQDKLVLEIGAWKGRSTVALARSARFVLSVDHHQGSAEHGPHVNTLPEFVANLETWGVRDKVGIAVLNARWLREWLLPHSFDLVFVDGAHDVGSVLRDGKLALRTVKSTGLVCFHDYTTWLTVQTAVDILDSRHLVQTIPGTSLAVLVA